MRILECGGTPEHIGHATGEAFRSEIKTHFDLVARPQHPDWRFRWKRRLPIVLSTLERYTPDVLAEFRAIAAAANVPLDHILMVNHLHLWGNAMDEQYTEEGDSVDGCSNIAFTAGPDGPLLGKNNDGYYQTRNKPQKPVCIRKISPAHGIPVVIPATCGSVCTGDGLNAEGVAVSSSSVGSVFDQSDRHPAIRIWNYHALLRSESTADFVRMTTSVPVRGKGYSMVCIDHTGDSCSLEIPCPLVQIRRPAHAAGINCVNYYQLEQIAAADKRSPVCKANAVARKELLDSVLSGPGPFDLEAMKAVLRYRGDPSICCTEEADLLHTKYSIIAVPRSRRLYYCEGAPCEAEYQSIDL